MKKTKKVKAWAVFVYDDFISALISERGLSAEAIFDDASEAKKFIAEWPDGDEQNPTLVPCTITYTITKPLKKV